MSENKGHVFGIRGKQTLGGKPMLGEDGKPVHFKGVESELIGTGSELKEYEKYIIRLEMDNRPSTNKFKPNSIEGYASNAFIVRKLPGILKLEHDVAKKLNEACDFRLVGSPNEFVWILPKDFAAAGEALTPECVWEYPKANGVEGELMRLHLHKNQPTLPFNNQNKPTAGK